MKEKCPECGRREYLYRVGARWIDDGSIHGKRERTLICDDCYNIGHYGDMAMTKILLHLEDYIVGPGKGEKGLRYHYAKHFFFNHDSDLYIWCQLADLDVNGIREGVKKGCIQNPKDIRARNISSAVEDYNA